MPVFSTAYVKNIIRRGFSHIADPEPEPVAVEKIWRFFESRCAYCGEQLTRGSKEAHIDHLLSASNAGRNGIGNRLLACARCNEKDKRDLPWEEFLGAKQLSPDVFVARRDRILCWQALNASQISSRQEEIDKLAAQSAAEVIELFDHKVTALRAFMRDGP